MVMRELRDELEVPGHVVMIVHQPKEEVIAEMRSLLDSFERDGFLNLNQVPEGERKQRFRELAKAVGIKPEF